MPESYRVVDDCYYIVLSTGERKIHKGKEWDTFGMLYDEYDEWPEGYQFGNSNDTQDFSPAFLSHAMIYVFADKYDIEPLQDISLNMLFSTLYNIELYHRNIGDFVCLFEYGYNNTCDRLGKMDRLRELLSTYAVCILNYLMERSDFVDLLRSCPDLGKDLLRLTCKRNYYVEELEKQLEEAKKPKTK